MLQQAQTEARMNMIIEYTRGPESLRPNILGRLTRMLEACNPLVQEFQRIGRRARVGGVWLALSV
jgi:hypothetical protein